MDDYKELNKWILAHSKSLDLQVERLHWVNDWLPGYHDFCVTGKAFGRIFEGRGTDKNEEVAFYKSFSELVERIYCFGHKLNSNGVATHVHKRQAVANAKKELIERDAILCHYLTKNSFQRHENFLIPNEFEELSSRLKKDGITLNFGWAHSISDNYHVAICHADGGEHFGTLCGFGCNESSVHSIESAILECMINVVAHLNGNLDLLPLSPNELYELNSAKGLDHKRVHFSYKLFELNIDKVDFAASVKMEEHEFEIQTLKAPLPLFDNIPLYVARATSVRLQNMYYGQNQKQKINFERLKVFAGREVSLEMLPATPHPIG